MSNGQGKSEAELFEAAWGGEEVTPTAQQPKADASNNAAAMVVDGDAAGAQTPPAGAAATDEAGSNGGSVVAGDGGTGGGTGTEQPAGTAGQPDPQDDWIASLPPDAQERIRAERKAAEDRYAALHGRVAPVQRALTDAQRKLAEREAQPRQPAAQAGATAAPATAADDSFFDSPRWKKWAEDFPGDAEVMRAAFEQQRAEGNKTVRELQERLQQIEQQVTSATRVTGEVELTKQIAELEAKHPDWKQIDQSDEFWDWFDGYRAVQPAEVRDAYYDQATVSRWFRDASFTSRMLDMYKRETGYTPPAAAQKAAPTQSTNSTEAPAPNTSAADVRLRMGTTPDVRAGNGAAAARVPLDSLDEGAQFAAVWAQTEQQR